MTTRKILVQGHPILKKKAKAVKKLTAEHQKLIDDMIETMVNAPGVGLAAPQVGVSERIIVADVGNGPFCVVNPKITARKGKITCTEGCLSVPGLEAPVERSEQVSVTGRDRRGKEIKIDADELLAIVMQHEIDHLDGVLFVERVADPSTIVFSKPKKKEIV